MTGAAEARIRFFRFGNQSVVSLVNPYPNSPGVPEEGTLGMSRLAL